MKSEKQSAQSSMGSLDKFSVLLKYDSRVTTQNKRLGLVNDSELKEHVGSLPDSGGNLDHVKIDDIAFNGSGHQ